MAAASLERGISKYDRALGSFGELLGVWFCWVSLTRDVSKSWPSIGCDAHAARVTLQRSNIGVGLSVIYNPKPDQNRKPVQKAWLMTSSQTSGNKAVTVQDIVFMVIIGRFYFSDRIKDIPEINKKCPPKNWRAFEP